MLHAARARSLAPARARGGATRSRAAPSCPPLGGALGEPSLGDRRAFMGARRHDGAGKWCSPAPFAANLSDVGNRSACDAIVSGRSARAASELCSGHLSAAPLGERSRGSHYKEIVIKITGYRGHLACDAIESGRLAAARSACASECGLPLGRPLVKSGRLSASSAPVSNHRVISNQS
jgi:hypothetical protein